MYHQLATRFGRNAHQISGCESLDNEALYRHVPCIFARKMHDSRSERYVYVPTIEIVEGLRREGWFPFFAVQSVPRDDDAKHMLRLRWDDGVGKPEAAEVIIVNSHDGTSAYQMFAGILRFVRASASRKFACRTRAISSMTSSKVFTTRRVPQFGRDRSGRQQGRWDMSFVPAEVRREQIVDHGPAYVTYTSSYLVRAGSDIARWGSHHQETMDVIEARQDIRDDPVGRPCGRLPILDEFEDRELAEIDTSEWYMPSADEGRRLAQAGDRLGVYLMTYRAERDAKAGRGLCNRIVPARLNTTALEEIIGIETALPDVVVVAYERPLRRRG